jgi:hypothetical protein
MFMRWQVPFGLAVLSAAFAAEVSADDAGYDVNASSGSITVTAHAGFHINKEYPWKVTVGAKKVGKDDFKLDAGKATVGGLPSGHAVLKGAVCKGAEGSSSACLPFTRELDL